MTPTLVEPGVEERIPAIKETRSNVTIAGVVTLSILAAYMLLIHNRYMPIQEGWFSEYGRYMLRGRLPYRDFYFFGQPLPLFLSAFLVKLGDRMIYMRYYALAERLVLYGTLFFILSRRFSAAASCIGTLTSGVFLLSYFTDAFYTYLYTCLLFAVLSVAALQAAYRRPARRRVFFLVAGACASLSFFAKQSNGLLVTAAILVCVVVLSGPLKRASVDLGYTLLGWIAAAAPFAAWLTTNGIWRVYWAQVFGGAVQSKGSFRAILFKVFTRSLEPMSVDTIIVLALVTTFLIYEKKLFLVEPKHGDTAERRRVLYYAGAGVVVIFLPFAWRLTPVHAYWTVEAALYFVDLTVYWLVAMAVWLLYRRFIARWKTAGDESLMILAIVSGAWVYGCGASFKFEQQAMVPMLALVMAFVYDHVSFRRPDLVKKLVILLSLVMLLDTAMEKYTIAFTWIGWREQVSENPKASHWKELAGYRLDQSTVRVYDTILDEIAARATKTDVVFTFPVMPIFNYVSRRPQPTFALVHYWDVCPDWLAVADAERVRIARPRFIVNMDMPEDIWKYHESVFRMNHPAGQRAIQRVIDALVASGDYKLLREFNTPFFRYPVYLWWREK